MKKIIFLTFITILIPFIIVTLFVTKEKEIKFNYNEGVIVRVKREKEKIIDYVYLEDYITGVLAGELPINFSKETFKAQSVAARSYVLKKMQYNKNNEYDVVDTVSDQVYLDEEFLKKSWGSKYVQKINKIKSAVIETIGEYMEYDGNVIDAFFFSTSTGFTENSEDIFLNKVPYLRSVKSEWDKISPVYETNLTISLDEFYSKLKLPYSDILNCTVMETTGTGRVKKIKINNAIFSGNEVYSKLNLKSTYFDIEQILDSVYIKVKGYGHGVGMSQYGAEGMAQAGYMYDEILKYYYQGVNLKKL